MGTELCHTIWCGMTARRTDSIALRIPIEHGAYWSHSRFGGSQSAIAATPRVIIGCLAEALLRHRSSLTVFVMTGCVAQGSDWRSVFEAVLVWVCIRQVDASCRVEALDMGEKKEAQSQHQDASDIFRSIKPKGFDAYRCSVY